MARRMRERPGFRTLEYILREDEGEDRKCSVLQKARDLPEMTREEMYKAFGNRSIEDRQPTEAQITAILRSVGKYTEEDELNCGACGYPTCRDKAVAVFQGKAEVSMCMPYALAQAESMSNVVMDVTPNMIFVVDHDMKILDCNRKGRSCSAWGGRMQWAGTFSSLSRRETLKKRS